MKRFSFPVFVLAGTCFFASASNNDILDYVDPMIGTDGIGHTFPGATTPFGMIQLSPSNDFKAWNWCSGYHYSDTVLKGFAHTHFSGAGLAGLGDVLLMPTLGSATTQPGTETQPESGYRSRFSHERETAKAGYYAVHLDDYDIDVELTATARVGFHRYTFNRAGQANIVVDPTHHLMEAISETAIEILSDTEIRGYKTSNGESGKRTVYFYATFSKPFASTLITDDGNTVDDAQSKVGSRIASAVSFDVKAQEQINVKVGLSHTSYSGAYENFMAEANDTTFDQAYANAQNQWRDKINTIQVDMLNEEDLRTFATSMYHSFIHPNVISDVNGDFYLPEQIFNTDYPQYSNYSTWDTFRTLHPLYTLIEHEKTAEFVNSLASRKTVSDMELPVWEAMGHDNVCMIGHNTVSVMADAILKDVSGIDIEAAYTAMRSAAFDTSKHSPNYDFNGMEDYIQYHYVPGEIGASVSKTTEYNYFDWTISQVAKKLGYEEDYGLFKQRSIGYRTLFEADSGYLAPRNSTGELQEQNYQIWDDLISNYVSGNVWGYSNFVPHDVAGLIELHGGKQEYAEFLDKIFADESEIGGSQHVDISGFIGKYGHGDEPSQHIPYFYMFLNQPWKTQSFVRQVLRDFYSDKPDGLINNDDLGQMSAWYIFSSMGFYPVNPGDLRYVIGSPLVKNAAINLANNKQFRVSVDNQSEENKYVKAVFLNGSPFNDYYITHDQIMAGGHLHFVMTSEPMAYWGSDVPVIPEPIKASVKYTPKITAAAHINGSTFFSEQTEITLTSLSKGDIRYTLDGSEPTQQSTLYVGPIQLKDSAEIKVKVFVDGNLPSKTASQVFYRSLLPQLDNKASITLAHQAHKYGDPSGSQLIDGKVGALHFADGNWSGFTPSGLNGVIDFGSTQSITTVSINALVDTQVWIFPPKQLALSVSQDGENWTSIATKEGVSVTQTSKGIQHYRFDFPTQSVRYLKVDVDNFGPLPRWHAGDGKAAFLFIDEIVFH